MSGKVCMTYALQQMGNQCQHAAAFQCLQNLYNSFHDIYNYPLAIQPIPLILSKKFDTELSL